MTVTRPPDIEDGVYTAARGQQHSDAIEANQYPPHCKAWHSVTASHTTATVTLIELQSESWDSTGSMHSTSSNPSRIIVPEDGLYAVVAQVRYASNSTGRRICQVRKNAAGSSSGGTQVGEKVDMTNSTSTHDVMCVFECQLAANDYLEMFGLQQSGGNLSTVGSSESQTFMSVRWVARLS